MKSVNFLFPARLLGVVFAGLMAAGMAVADHNTPEALEARTMPVGRLNVVAASDLPEGGGGSGGGDEAQSGEAVYKTTCAVCHDAGIAGAPKTGDVAGWKARIAQGMAVLVEHAVNGFQGETGIMIAKGGNPALSDAEVEGAVVYMVEQSQ